MLHKRLVTLCVLLSLLAACRPVATPPPTAGYPAEVATRWFELQLQLIRQTPGFTPPVASRALGYSGVTLYETVVAGMPEHNSLVGQLNGLTALPQPEAGQSYHWAAAANSALATLLRRLYPTAKPENLSAIDSLEGQYAGQYRLEAGEAAFNRSAAYGQAVAEAVFEWSRADGGDAAYAGSSPGVFTPSGEPGAWSPTPPKYQAPLLPVWGENRPFVLQSGGECAPPPPTAYSEDLASQFYAEGLEVYTTVKNLSPEQRAIALFWADDPGRTSTPPGHFIAIATQVLQQDNASLALAAETYARVGVAVADAFISCWHAKYTYRLVRPITYIQANIDPAWNNPEITDPVVTPPFPEYTSGHSVQSGAAATVLTALFGDSQAFTDASPADLGLPARTFSSFFAAANEAAISRLYAGVHFRPAIELGLAQGICIGDRVDALAWRK